MRNRYIIGLALAAILQQAEATELPADVARFVERDTTAIALEKGDINGDGRPDYLLVLEHREDTRDLLILVRAPDGALKLAGRNRTILECQVCEGAGGDIRVTPTGDGFTIEDNAGAGDVGRALFFKFKYVPQEATWVLVEVTRESYAGQVKPKKDEKLVTKPYDEG
jgi:hypothetical protein